MTPDPLDSPDLFELERRVLLLAPTARDAQASSGVLRGAGIKCQLVSGLVQLCTEIEAGAGAIILPQEVLGTDTDECLMHSLSRQPVWSDLPIVVLSRSGLESPLAPEALERLGNVSVVERPVRINTLLSVVRTGLRARERQYLLRDHLTLRAEADAERDRLLVREREARQAAERADSEKDQFLAVLSHELRTPLSPVIMSVAALEHDADLPYRLRDEMAMIRRNIELETKLIDDLLDLSRVTTGKLRLDMRPTRVTEVLRYVLEVTRPDIQARRLHVGVAFEAIDDLVNADTARLQQVFWNIVRNAVKFTPEDGRIEVRSRNSAPGKISVEIRDSGLGIPPEVLDKVFDAFEQGDRGVTREFGGLGLGLAISKAVVDMHGGSIQVASEGRGKGAQFTVVLNTTSPLLSEMPSDRPRRNGAASEISRSGMRVLLVEDHPDTSRVLGRLLRGRGLRVGSAHSVASALELIESETFDIIVSDIGLPDASGYELMRQIRQRFDIKGIALSGYGMEDDLRKSREAGFSEHVVKPVNVDQLMATINRVVSGG